jgi:hypothetical protein
LANSKGNFTLSELKGVLLKKTSTPTKTANAYLLSPHRKGIKPIYGCGTIEIQFSMPETLFRGKITRFNLKAPFDVIAGCTISSSCSRIKTFANF